MYICEISGDDETGLGTKEKPFKTAIKGIEVLQNQINQASQIQIRKSIEEDYQEISGAGLKKAKKGYEINLKKLGKSHAKALADQEIAEKSKLEELKRLEDAKNIHLKLDSTLPQAHKVIDVIF